MNRVEEFCNQPCPEVICSELISKHKSKVVTCGKYNKHMVDTFHAMKEITHNQRWSPQGRPRGHILKSLASKVKFLASRPQVLENWPALGSRTLFLNCWNFVDCLKKNFRRRFLLENTCACVLGLSLKHSCPWTREGLSSEGLFLALASFFFVSFGLDLKSYVFDSTSAHNRWLW